MNSDYLETLRAKEILSVEMVCLGNICRSPIAAAVLEHKSREFHDHSIHVTSSGTSNYHIGDRAHPLSQKTWEGAGYEYVHSARQFNPSSFQSQDLILTMDLSNRAMVLTAAKNESDRQRVFLLRQFDPALSNIDPLSREASELQVPDPWGEELDAYQEVLEMIERAVNGLLNKIR